MTRQAIGAIETEVALLMRRGETTRRATPVTAHRALDRAAYLLLRRLDQDGPQNVSTLAAALHLDGSTVTRQVAALLRDGLVTRERDPQDGRGAVISATATGAARVAAVREARQKLYDQILAGWSAEERETLARYLHRLNAAIDDYTRSPKA
jgi:DNA-binding MarR family transcriptional regulator